MRGLHLRCETTELPPGDHSHTVLHSDIQYIHLGSPRGHRQGWCWGHVLTEAWAAKCTLLCAMTQAVSQCSVSPCLLGGITHKLEVALLPTGAAHCLPVLISPILLELLIPDFRPPNKSHHRLMAEYPCNGGRQEAAALWGVSFRTEKEAVVSCIMEADSVWSKFVSTVRTLTESAHAKAQESNVTDGVKICVFPGNSPWAAAVILHQHKVK